MKRFQKDAYSVSAKLSGTFSKAFPDLSVQDYRAALRGVSPLVSVLNAMILESAHILNTEFNRAIVLTTARSSQVQAIGAKEGPIAATSFLMQGGLSKYFIAKGVFTMRASHSIVLTQAQVVKSIVTQLKKAGPTTLD